MTRDDLPAADLAAAQDGSWYFIAGCGGDLADWIAGYERVMADRGIGTPEQWYVATGAQVNDQAFPGGWTTAWPECFKPDLTCLLFPLDGLHHGYLPLFKLVMADRWFDDVIANMRRHLRDREAPDAHRY